MTEPFPPTIGYASLAGDDPALSRWLRRAVGWAAVAYGGCSALAHAYFFALSRKWFRPWVQVDFGQFSRLEDAITWAAAGAMAVVCVGGVLVLRKAPAGVAVLRLGIGLVLLTSNGQQVYRLVREPMNVAFHAMNVMSVLSGSTLPALLFVLTLGPFGRTLRRA